MRIIILCSILFFASALTAITVETASLSGFMYGTTDGAAYDDFYHRIVEGLASAGYNQYAPWDRQTNGFGNFVNANATQRANWGVIVDLFLDEQFTEAQALIDQHGYPYHVVEFHDTDTDRTYYMLREQLNMSYFDDNNQPLQPQIHQHGSFDYGWGLYVFNPSSDIPVVVNVVHPKDDFISIPVATEAFKLWDARYMMIAGAGREVLWTNEPPYFNSKSLSDPSRNLNHAFNVTYQRICDEIRSTFGRRELSIQIHSYDYTHTDYNALQFSGGGWAYNYPGLPVRDLSGNNLDLINASPYVVIPANTIGIHDDVLVTDYYSVLYDPAQEGLYYHHGDLLIPISNNINLPGADGNHQVAYTRAGWNLYDTIDPFIHMEMEELPTVYPQTMNYYRWLYGFDAVTQTWNADEFWTRALQFYMPWVEHMAEVLPYFVEFDDGVPPTNPANLAMVSASYNNIVLEWERSYAYDFESYEILYATEPIDLFEQNYSIRDRSNISTLAGQAFTRATVTGLQPETQYYFQVRARDYNGNLSGLTNEIEVYTGIATIANLAARGRDGYVDLSWVAQFQSNNQGFNIWRAVSGTDDYQLVATWETDDTLVFSTSNNVTYTYVDNTVENGVVYDYRISSVNYDFEEFVHVFVASAHAEAIYTLTFQNSDGSIYDTVEVGFNHFATDGYNSHYDILKGGSPGGSYIYAMSYKANWNQALRNLQRDIYGYFDTDSVLKTWVLRASTNQTNQPISISVSDNYGRYGEKMYLRDSATGSIVDLTEEPLVYEASGTGYRYFTLYWGNFLPTVSIPNLTNRFLQAGDQFNFTWSTTFNILIDSIDLYLHNGVDSVFVASDLSNTATSFSWTVPHNTTIKDANLVVRANIVNGFPLDNYSNYRFGVIPAGLIIDNSAGWHLKSSPFESPLFDGATLFGQDSYLYSYDYDDEEYIEVVNLMFGESYWVFMPQDYDATIDGTIRKMPYEIELRQGWNLIPNVFLTDFHLSSFRFILGDAEYSFMEALQYNMIERGLYDVSESRYRLEEQLIEQGSVWFYAKVPNLILKLTPFNRNLDHDDFNFLWQTRVIASQANYLGDEIVVGSAEHTDDDYDRLFDLPKAPHRPETDFRFYLAASEDTHPYTELHSYFKMDLNDPEEDYRYWDFVLHIDPDLQPVHFRKAAMNLPDNYNVVLLTDGVQVILFEDEDFVLIPESQVITGQIMVTNQTVTSVEDIPEASTLFSNYPNPFFAGSSTRRNTGTNIAFYMNKSDNVRLEIFNIKGQRVITLLNEKRDAGMHTVSWEGIDNRNKPVAAGIYFYRLSIGDGTSHVKKMMLLK